MRFEAAVALAVYCISSCLMVVLNKYVLSGHSFGLNFLLLTAQSAVSIVLLVGLRSAGAVQFKPLKREAARTWFPISLLLVAMIYSGSKSLQFLPVSLFTVFKNVTIVVIALIERQLMGSEISRLAWTSFAMIIGSSVIGAMNDLSFNARGYAWMFANCSASAAYTLGMRYTIKQVRFAELDTVLYNNALALPVMALFSLFIDDWASLAEICFGDGPMAEKRTALFLGIGASSLAAFMISYATAWCARVATSTSYGMVGSLNKLPIALSGALFFPEERKAANRGNLMSILLAFASGMLYSWAKLKASAEKDKARSYIPLHVKEVEREGADERVFQPVIEANKR